MALRFSDTALRRILGVLLGLVLIYESGVAWTLWSYMVTPEKLARRPFELYSKVSYVTREAVAAGLARGDSVISVDGQPCPGNAVFNRAFHRIGPGGYLDVEWLPAAGGEPRKGRILLQPMERPAYVLGNVWADFGVQLVASLFCLALGFWVAFLRPRDVRAWILLGLMISFRGFLEIVSRQSHWPPGMQELALLFKQFIPATWPVWMMLMGLLFPEPLHGRRWPTVVVKAVSIAVLAFAAASTLTQWAFYHDLALLKRLSALTSFQVTISNVLASMGGIGLFYTFIGMQWGMARTADAKRRATLLNIGAHVSLFPMFVLIVRALVLRLDNGWTGVPLPIVIFCYAMMSLFPLTLAYIIVVHRAMGVAMVLRTGLQYALAQRGLRYLQVGLTIATVIFVMKLSETNLPLWLKIAFYAGLGRAIFALGRAGDGAAKWMDRKFFREAYNSEQILSELSEEVRSIVETRPLLERVTQRISESLHVPRVAALLKDGGSFVPAYATGGGGGTPFPGSGAVAQRLRESGEPQICDSATWTGGEDQARLADMGAQLLLPLRARHELVGFISLGAKRSEEPYSRSDLQLLKSVAAQAGLALENSRLMEESASEAARREIARREMRIARDVQQRLFPQRLPLVAGIDYAGACRPAQDVGGDYYDFIEIAGGEFGVAIGDVSGKGVPAALLMAGLVAALRGQAMNAHRDLAELMSNVNKLIYGASPKSHFATLFYAQYDPVTRRLRYANAGHNPPLWFRASGEVEFLRPTGPGIGLSPRAVYKQVELQLAEGDLLVAYTDGFTEAMSPEQAEFGEDRLREAVMKSSGLPPKDMIPALMAAVDAFAAGAPQSDDMTMAILAL